MAEKNIIEVKPEDKWTEVRNKKNNIKNLLEIESKYTHKKNNLYRTRFCNNKSCSKINCRFAHSLNEIVTINCFHDLTCRQVCFKNNKVFNKSMNFCKFKHSKETKKEYLYRVGYIKKDIVEINTTKERINEDIQKMLENGINKFIVNIT